MNVLVDFDYPDTFPKDLREQELYFNELIDNESIKGAKTKADIDNFLESVDFKYNDFITNYMEINQNIEFVGYHCTRIKESEQIINEGIITGGGHGGIHEKRIKELLKEIDVDDNQIDYIISKANVYWKRDVGSRIKQVNFFFSKKYIYESKTALLFTQNLGGEILRWALRGVDIDLYKQEPYNKLWIEGIPTIIKFKYKLSEVEEWTQRTLIYEMIKYNIIKKILNYDYKFESAGRTIDKVLPKNIIESEILS